jgi:hypothetical protein
VSFTDVNNDTVTVDFPEFLGWEGRLSEVELVLSLVSLLSRKV